MYKKFNLEISNSFYESELKKYQAIGQELYTNYEEKAKKRLKAFLYDNGNINGTSIRKHWFQMVDADVFISHSHRDIAEVKALAGWLSKEFGLNAFIDSCAWGYCDDLLKRLDDKYCLKEDGDRYDYELRNYTTSHVHMMLASALTEMIDRTECIMFYNTPESVSLKENINTIKRDREKEKVTLSPWIYHELAMSSMVRIRKPDRDLLSPILEKVMAHMDFTKSHDIHIQYDVEEYIDGMIPINEEVLTFWKRKYSEATEEYTASGFSRYFEGFSPLDILYQL